jgi:hypothetical protein
MPAPPPADLDSLEDEEPEFDLSQLHAEEDQEEDERGADGPLRVFLGAAAEDDSAPQQEENAPAVFDVSALAMPEGPSAHEEETEDDVLDFLDDSIEVDEDSIVNLGGTPPPISMGVSDEVLVDEASVWGENSTMPTMPTPSLGGEVRTAVIRDTPPIPTSASELPQDPVQLPESDSFIIGEDDLGILGGSAEDFSEDEPTRVEEGAPGQVAWDDEDMGFFDEVAPTQVRVPPTPPSLKVDAAGESRSFRPIPEKEDPPILPLLVILALIAVLTVLFLVIPDGNEEPTTQTVVEPAPVVAPPIQPTAPAPRTEARGQVGEVVGNMGYLSIDSDKPANIYVDDRKVGVTPVVRTEVTPGGHRVLAVEVETGKRKALTASVKRGEERRVQFGFQPVQR